MIDVFSIIDDNIPFVAKNNIICFILNEEDRPWWSKQLEAYFTKSGQDLNMGRNYKSQKRIMTASPSRERFIDFISGKRGAKVDLASGPSGYFSAMLNSLTDDDIFVITDACPTVISAHSRACSGENIFVFDTDLDKKLPFKDSIIDVFSGNLLSNVNNYAGLIKEAYRCLKPGGHLALIEMFFEYGCKTYEHLNLKGEIWASFETFVAFCEKIGFTLLGSDIISSRKGKISEGDLYPLDNNDCWSDRTLYFIKND